MLYSYTTGRNHFGDLTKDSSTTNLTFGDLLINSFTRKIIGNKPWPFLEKLLTMTTTASTQFKVVPYNLKKIRSVFVTVGTRRYTPTEAPSREFWDRLNLSTYTSDVPQYWCFYDGQLGLWPTSATSSNIISIDGTQSVKDLSVADYTTGGVLTATAASAALVGTGTTWTAAMGLRWINITDSDTANKGDGFWYKISSVASATTLTLERTYGGTSIAAGNAAYTIAQVSLLPEDYQVAPILYAASVYWAREKNPTLSAEYKMIADELVKQLNEQYGMKSENVVIDTGEFTLPENTNLYIV